MQTTACTLMVGFDRFDEDVDISSKFLVPLCGV
jgi:hypothetical protein